MEVTPFAGLLPLMMDRSRQAPFLIPMAVSLACGVILATSVRLYLVPSSRLIVDDLKQAAIGFRGWYMRLFELKASFTH